MLSALGVAARPEGMTKLAARIGLNRQALSEEGNSTLAVLLGVLSAVGIRLKCEIAFDEAAQGRKHLVRP